MKKLLLIFTLIMVLSSCGDIDVNNQEDACEYWHTIDDNPNSKKSQKILNIFKDKIKKYSAEVTPEYSEFEKDWEEKEDEMLKSYGSRFFYDLCHNND